jgi:type VI protein secretion system component VasF
MANPHSDGGANPNPAPDKKNTQPPSEAEKPLGREEFLAMIGALNAIASQQKASADEQSISDSRRLQIEGEANERERARLKMERWILAFVCATALFTLWQVWEMRATVNVMRDQTQGIVDAGDGSWLAQKWLWTRWQTPASWP